METYVIVGASLAGAKAAETLRAEGFSGRVLLIGEEGERPYERPPLSKGYLLGSAARDTAYVHEEHWYREHRVELRLAVRVTMLDVATRELTLDGADKLGYDKLLLATGSRVLTLRVPGVDLHGVRYLRTMDESDALRASLTSGAKVVVVGAGWIGLETAAAARHHGAEVTVVELDELPLRRVLGSEVAQVFAGLHQAHGVRFRFSTRVTEILGANGDVTGVRLADGSELPADVVLIAVGIRPATELAEVAGLAVNNGVVTDERLRTSDPDVYACGDVANSYHPLIGKRIRVEHWANALNGGPTAARSMLGRNVSYDRVPYFFTDQYGLGMEYSGYAAPGDYDRVVFRGDPTVKAGAGEYIAFWVAGGRVLAGMNVNVWDITEPIQELIRAGYAGHAVDLDRLADPAVPVADLVP